MEVEGKSHRLFVFCFCWGFWLGLTAIFLCLSADVGGFFKNPDGELLVRWYQVNSILNASMDDSPFKQTFELGIFISAAGKSILNLVKW